MALIDILEKIDANVAKQIAQLQTGFNKKKAELTESYEEKKKTVDKDIHTKVEEKSKNIIDKATNFAEIEGKREILKAKRTMITEILDKAIKTLSSDDNYVKTITSLLKTSDLEGDNVVVVPAQGKEKETKEAIKASGKTFFLSDKSRNIKGGVILKTDTIEIDDSFETIVKKEMGEDLEISLHNLLF